MIKVGEWMSSMKAPHITRILCVYMLALYKHAVKSGVHHVQNLGEDLQVNQEKKKAIASCDCCFMLMSLRSTVGDANGQESKH